MAKLEHMSKGVHMMVDRPKMRPPLNSQDIPSRPSRGQGQTKLVWGLAGAVLS